MLILTHAMHACTRMYSAIRSPSVRLSIAPSHIACLRPSFHRLLSLQSALLLKCQEGDGWRKRFLSAGTAKHCSSDRLEDGNTGVKSQPGARFNYDNQEAWKEIRGCCAGGRRQSPVDIATQNAIASANLRPVVLKNWNVDIPGVFVNTDQSIRFVPLPSSPKTKIVDSRSITYAMTQFHFHWGTCVGEGSEHKLDGRQFDCEVHFVLAKEGGTKMDIDHISVVAVLYKACDSSSPIWHQLNVPVEFKGQVQATIKYGDFLPEGVTSEISDYFLYNGSLTTPPCTEVVQWLVLKKTAAIPTEFLSSLRQVQDEGGQQLTSTFRNVQPLNARQVYTT